MTRDERTGWLCDEGALLDYYEGLECEECGWRGGCDCDCEDEEEGDGE